MAVRMQIDFSTREGRRVQGRLLQQAAEDAGLSLETLAREIGCSRALIYQYVSGATLAQPDRIQQIAERTGKPLLYFYGGEATPENLMDRVLALQALLDAQLGPADPGNAISTAEQLIALARQAADVRLEAHARVRLVTALLQRGEAPRALQSLAQTLPFLRHHGLTAMVHAAEQSRGHALLVLGQVDEADACFTALARQAEWSVRWQAMVSLAGVAEFRGQYLRALEYLDDAAALATTAPNPRAGNQLALYVAGNLANVHLACGDHAAATTQARRALELAEQLANRDQYTEALLTLGVCHRMAGHLSASLETLTSAVRHARLSHDGGHEALGRAELAATLIIAGRADEGREQAKDALQQSIATSTRRAELFAQLALAWGYLVANMPRESRYHAAQAWEIGAHLGHPFLQSLAHIVMGDAHRQCGDVEEARQAYAQAITLADGIGARLAVVFARLGAAQAGVTTDWDSLIDDVHDLQAPDATWMTHLLAGTAREEAGQTAQAVAHYQEAISALNGLREDLRRQPDGDTLLENRLAWQPYQRLAGLYRATKDVDAAERVLRDAEWPPMLEPMESLR